MSNSIRIDGLGEVLKEFDIVDEQSIKNAIGKACALVEREAKKKAPKGEYLRDSIKSKIEGHTGIVYTPLEYAPYVEYGTGIHAEGGNGRQDVPWVYCDDKGEFHTTEGQHPHPYMRPALYENKQKIIRILKENLLSK